MKVILYIQVCFTLFALSRGGTNGFSVEIYPSEIGEDTPITALSSVKYHKNYLFL